MKPILFALVATLAACGSSKPASEPTTTGTGTGTTTGTPADSDANCTAPKPTPDSVCMQDCGGPAVESQPATPAGWSWLSPDDAANRTKFGCPICLPPDALIATPTGDVPLSSLVAGSLVYSTDDHGHRITVPVVRVGSTLTPRTHALLTIDLDDGREVSGSPGHPTTDARVLGALRVGDSLDGAKVTAISRRPFGTQRTYDLLPASETRAYWANGVLLSSTLLR